MILPSGVTVRVRVAGEGAPVADDTVDGEAVFGGRLWRAVEQGRLVLTRDGRALSGEALLDLTLRDLHALRDAAERLAVIAAEPMRESCRNCDADFEPDPTEAPTDDLDEWYEDDPGPPSSPFALPEPVRVGGGWARTLDMHPVTAREAWPLWRAIADGDELELTPAIVEGLGIAALGSERDPAKIARALESAPDDVWLAVQTLFSLLSYADHASFPAVCGKCGAVHDVPAPSSRETDEEPRLVAGLLGDDAYGLDERSGGWSLPDQDTFAELVERLGEAIYAEQGVRNIALHVDFETPPVDGAGEPLMGSYEPRYDTDAAGYTDVQFVITVYYRTFVRMWEQDGPFDVEGEVRETIEHEIEHHIHHLAGHDPKDEQERREARQDLERTFGKRAVRRAEMRDVMSELRRIGVVFLVLGVLLGATIGLMYALGILRD